MTKKKKKKKKNSVKNSLNFQLTKINDTNITLIAKDTSFFHNKNR